MRASLYSRAKWKLFWIWSPAWAAFSLASRSECQGFLRGGEIAGAAVGCAFLDFSRHGRSCFGSGIIGSATNPNSRLLFLALIAVLDSSSLLGLVAPRRLFKLRGQLWVKSISCMQGSLPM